MTSREAHELLSAPFAEEEVRWVPIQVKGGRALVAAYIDVRSVQNRLDAVLGLGAWAESYHVLAAGDVVCTLRVLIDGRWVERSDVGSAPETSGFWLFRRWRRNGDRIKAAFSDAMKRAAVKLGIGRYLHSIAPLWVDYDPGRKQLLQTPKLAPSVLPKPPTEPAP